MIKIIQKRKVEQAEQRYIYTYRSILHWTGNAKRTGKFPTEIAHVMFFKAVVENARTIDHSRRFYNPFAVLLTPLQAFPKYNYYAKDSGKQRGKRRNLQQRLEHKYNDRRNNCRK